MDLLETFRQYYNGLDTISLVAFWVTFFIFFFFVFATVNLYIKNKKLVGVIEEIKKANELSKKTTEFVNKVNISEQKVEEKIKEVNKVEQVKEEIKEIKEEIKELKEDGPYAKNVLRENAARYQTSPISIKKDDDKVPLEKVTKEEVEEDNNNLSYTYELSKKMEEEIKPQTIELTDYEKQQEEEAIISYKELLKASKDRLYNISEEESNVDFIQELKSFRSSL